MFTMPIDIQKKIDQLFADTSDNQEVKELILNLWKTSLNVGAAQLARSILTISDGDVQKIKNIIEEDFMGDPRDVIMEAEKQSGNPEHYFIPTFDEIENEK